LGTTAIAFAAREGEEFAAVGTKGDQPTFIVMSAEVQADGRKVLSDYKEYPSVHNDVITSINVIRERSGVQFLVFSMDGVVALYGLYDILQREECGYPIIKSVPLPKKHNRFVALSIEPSGMDYKSMITVFEKHKLIQAAEEMKYLVGDMIPLDNSRVLVPDPKNEVEIISI